jgi:hypothetical protein
MTSMVAVWLLVAGKALPWFHSLCLLNNKSHLEIHI